MEVERQLYLCCAAIVEVAGVDGGEICAWGGGMLVDEGCGGSYLAKGRWAIGEGEDVLEVA